MGPLSGNSPRRVPGGHVEKVPAAQAYPRDVCMHTNHVPIFAPFRVVARTVILVIRVLILILVLLNFLGVLGGGMKLRLPN